MKNILVTGGAGFIGTNFVYYWLDRYPDDHVVVLDALTYAGIRKNLDQACRNPKFEFIHGNIIDGDLVDWTLRNHNIDTIVHFAAESHVDRSISFPDKFIETNIIGTHCLLKAAWSFWKNQPWVDHRFHHISTDEVYGTLNWGTPPFKESDSYSPNSPYAASKAASDHLVRAYYKTYGLNVTTSNCSNNYGPYQFPEKLIPLMITNLLCGKPLPIYGDGKQIRDWLHVDDHSRGIDLILKKGSVGETYNIGGKNEWTNIDVVKLICNVIDTRIRNQKVIDSKIFDEFDLGFVKSEKLITFVKDRPGHDKRYAINADKITTFLGYEPEVTFEAGIEKTVDWYLDNDSWWKGIKLDGINVT